MIQPGSQEFLTEAAPKTRNEASILNSQVLFIVGGDLDRSDQRTLIPGISNRPPTIDGGKGLGDSSVTKSRI